MAGEARDKNRSNKKRSIFPRYFFLNGDLHRRLHISRGSDRLSAWNYPKGKRVTASYSAVLRSHQKAFKTSEVCEMVNRKHLTVEYAISRGMIERPQHTYGLDENRRIYQYMWKEEEIIGLLAYLSTVHTGRPRKDGLVTAANLPTPREVRAMINDENVLYVKQGDTYVPTWRAKEF